MSIFDDRNIVWRDYLDPIQIQPSFLISYAELRKLVKDKYQAQLWDAMCVLDRVDKIFPEDVLNGWAVSTKNIFRFQPDLQIWFTEIFTCPVRVSVTLVGATINVNISMAKDPEDNRAFRSMYENFVLLCILFRIIK